MHNIKEERRKSVRIKKALVARYSYDFNKKWDTTIINDISERGMCIATIKYFASNEILSFLIKIPFKPFEWMQFKGRVVVCEGSKGDAGEPTAGVYITRIEFIDLKEIQRKLIREYVAWFFKQRGREEKMSYTGPERRKHPRINASFIVSYRMLEEANNIDIAQTKNLSLGGMLLTTNRLFKPGTNLALEIRLPFDPNPIMIIGKVLESREVTKGLIYDTRLSFLAIDEKHRKMVSQTVDYYLKKPK